MKTKSSRQQGKSKRPLPRQAGKKRASGRPTSPARQARRPPGEATVPDAHEAAEFMRPIENAEALVRKIKQRPNSVFFYPAGLYDGGPLRHISNLCDTFIYSDVAFRPDQIIGGLQPMMAQAIAEMRVPLNIEEVPLEPELGLGIDEQPDWLMRYIVPQYKDQYAAAVAIVRQHGGPSGRKFECVVGGRTITIYCFCAEACHCYAALFARQNAAPRAVCLKQQIRGQRRFLDMDKWDAPLGWAVADSPQPEILVVEPDRQDDWPWNKKWNTPADWQAVAYLRQHPVTPSMH